MARVVGKAGRYAAEKVSRKWMAGLMVVLVGGMILGGFVGAAVAGLKWYIAVPCIGAELVLVVVVKRLSGKYESEFVSWKRGFDGEIAVGRSLVAELPDTYCVIHDVQTGYGNLDHVVVGPTGVFIVETKNVRGWVTPDGQGELLLNGNPTEKPFVRNLTRTIMAIRDKITVLSKSERYIQGVIVFPSAYEDAKFGTTGQVHCISIGRIPTYFLKPNVKEPLSAKEVDKISRAFRALASMDKGFPSDSELGAKGRL